MTLPAAPGYQAIILAGGKGTRLHPYTAVLPKPLMPVGEQPVLEILLRHMARHGLVSVLVAVNHLRHLIQTFFGDGSAFGMRIDYVTEDMPLGTCGPMAPVLDRMAPDFLALNGDLLTDLDLTALLAHHRREQADATVATMAHEHRLDYGVLDVDASGGRIIGYREKPASTHLIGMGLYVLRREAVREHLHPGQRRDMPELLGDLIAAQRRVLAFRAACMWLDIGRPDDYARAQGWAERHAAGGNAP